MTETRPHIASVEEVREQLRRLGYFDSGLDRFVLGGAGARSSARAALRVALRVGAAAGPLLGLALGLAAASLDARLLAEPRDLVVLALYLALLTGLLVAAGAFALALVAAAVARRGVTPGPALPRNVGLVLGFAGLAYLALWWRGHGAQAPLLAQAAALVFGVGLALLLARLGSLAAVAALSAAGTQALPEARLSRRHVVGFVGGVGALLGIAVAASVFGERAQEQAPDFAVVPTGVRVRLLGIDGLEQRMAEQMVARGEMPNLGTLLATGARARLRAEPERVPAIVWTTIATGRGPEAHGIRATGARRLAGMRTAVTGTAGGVLDRLGAATDLLRLTRTQPPSSVLRGAKAIWNVASEKGLKVGVVNWWATWPCDTVNGYVVTDRTFFRVERGGPTDREACPPEVLETLAGLRPTGGDRAKALDLFYLGAARRLRTQAPPDLEAVYLPGLDIATTQLLGDTQAADLASLDQRLEAVRAHYRFVDQLLGDVRGDLGPAEALVLVGDPGRLARQAEGAFGLLVLAGAGFEPRDLGEAGERDIAPTVLHMTGLPISRELSGRVLEAALRADWRRKNPVRFVASYGRRPRARAAAASDFDAQVVEELKSLGYIQ